MTDNRRHSKIAELGLSEVVNELFTRGFTYEAIAEELAKRGHKVGKSSVGREYGAFQRQMAKVTALKEASSALATVLQTKDGEPDVNTSEMLLAVLQHTLLGKLTDEDLDIKEATALAIAGSQVARADAAIANTRDTKRIQSKRAYDKLANELKTLLQSSGLWPQVEAVIAKAAPE